MLAALDPTKDERHWLPLLSMFTGSRINELAQLHMADIMKDGIDFLHINEDEANARVKNRRRRKVSLHEELFKRGFLEFAEQLSKRGEKRIFTKLTHGKDGYGQSASKWYNRTSGSTQAFRI